MKKNNVIEFGDFKEQRELRKSEESYGQYLKSLSDAQLEPEVNHLLEEFSKDTYGKDFSSKVKLIFKEISSRSDGPVKHKINLLSDETLRLL